jgi:chemotaxis response regulator CheB
MKMRTNPIPDARIRVVMADDHPIVRGMVRSALQQHPHFEVCGEAEHGANAVEEVKRARPDVVVLNVTMPLVNGFEAAREIKKQIPETAIVILSSHADVHFVAEAKKHWRPSLCIEIENRSSVSGSGRSCGGRARFYRPE